MIPFSDKPFVLVDARCPSAAAQTAKNKPPRNIVMMDGRQGKEMFCRSMCILVISFLRQILQGLGITGLREEMV